MNRYTSKVAVVSAALMTRTSATRNISSRRSAVAIQSGERRAGRACRRLQRMPTDLDVYAPERWVDDALFRHRLSRGTGSLMTQRWREPDSNSWSHF
jgi:hypothetical protein